MKRLAIFPPKRRKGSYNAADRSQALLEFALALPILLMLLFGIIDLAALFQAWLTVENITRQTVRYAVTGQYDPTFCQDLDGSGVKCDSTEEEDKARLLSVQEYANRQTVALFRTPGAAQSEIGYMNITICSNRGAKEATASSPAVPSPLTFIEPNSSTYADCLKNGLSTSDAGGPGDRVLIAVDFNHPYITPFFNQVWPMTHLFSYRQGIVEMFRVPRLIALPPEVGGLANASDTPPATSTATVTYTPTVTNTPLPIYIEIVNPATSGQTITNVEQTRFEAIAWDPTYGTSNGNGIDNIKFWFEGPGYIPGRQDGQKSYCAFSGSNGACARIDQAMDYTTLPNGTYTIFARAEANDGRLSEIVSKTFILNFPPTPTPTITNTPTATPIPSCNDVFITDSQVRNGTNSSDFRVTVRNNNQAPGFLISSNMTWNSLYSPPLYFDYFWFLNTKAENRYYNPNPSNWYSGNHPTISWADSAGAPALLAGEAKTIWGSHFNLNGAPSLAGSFSVYLTFYFPNLGECAVSTTYIQPTATPTNIPPTATWAPPTPTPICNLSGAAYTTDYFGNPQNVNGYDCAYGCTHSPYLSSNGLPPGNYFWTVETVSGGKIQVNDGTFTLNPGQQLGPPSGVIIPLGRNMYNVPPNYFPGEFKVSVFQSSDPSCNAKTDNFKIQALAPTPVPTNTKGPTDTPKPTSTPAPATDTPIPPTPTLECFDC